MNPLSPRWGKIHWSQEYNRAQPHPEHSTTLNRTLHWIHLGRRRFPQSMWQVGRSSTGSRSYAEMWIMKMAWTLFSAQSLLFTSRGPLTLSSPPVPRVFNLHECPAGIPTLTLSDRLSLIQYSIGILHHFGLHFHSSTVPPCQAYAWVHQSVVSFWMVTRLHGCLFSTVVMKKQSPKWEKWTSQHEKDTKVSR